MKYEYYPQNNLIYRYDDQAENFYVIYFQMKKL